MATEHDPLTCELCHAEGVGAELASLKAEVDCLRDDLAKIGAAFAELWSQGLNGVVCDPCQGEIGRYNCRSCHEAWKAGVEVLDKYDPKYASLRGGPMFQPDFAAASTTEDRSDA